MSKFPWQSLFMQLKKKEEKLSERERGCEQSFEGTLSWAIGVP
jgi:hypothetical protein